MTAASDRPPTPAQLRSIHAAASRAGLADGEYRDMLQARFGVRSAKLLTKRQASDLLTSFGRPLPNPPGGRRRPRPRRPKPPPNVVALATPAQRRLIADLAGRVEWREGEGFERWLASSHGLRAVRTAAEASGVIEGLKRMCRAAGRWRGG